MAGDGGGWAGEIWLEAPVVSDYSPSSSLLGGFPLLPLVNQINCDDPPPLKKNLKTNTWT